MSVHHPVAVADLVQSTSCLFQSVYYESSRIENCTEKKRQNHGNDVGANMSTQWRYSNSTRSAETKATEDRKSLLLQLPTLEPCLQTYPLIAINLLTHPILPVAPAFSAPVLATQHPQPRILGLALLHRGLASAKVWRQQPPARLQEQAAP